MSGTQPNIILGFRPTPLGPNFGQTVADAGNMLQIQQQQDQVKRQNALMGIFKDPNALDQTGNPTPETLQKVMSVDPQTGLAMRQNAMIGQQRKLQMDAMSSDLMAKKMGMINENVAPILEAYQDAIKAGTPEAQARRDAQASLIQTNERMGKSGIFTPDEIGRFNNTFDPIAMQNVVAGTKQYQEWQKQREQDKKDERQGTTLLTDKNGRPFTFRPNAPRGKQNVYQDGTPVPDENMMNVAKVGAGSNNPAAAAERDAEIIARLGEKQKSGQPLTVEEQQQLTGAQANEKARADAAANKAGATAAAKQTETAKPEEITVNGVPQQGRFHDKQWFNLDGSPITGNVRLASAARADAKNADHIAIENDVKAQHPDWTPGQVAIETKAQEKLATTLPGSIAADRAALAADVKNDPAFAQKSPGEQAAEVEHRYQVSRQATMDVDVARNLARQYVATGNVNVFSGFRRNTQMMNQIEKEVIEEQTRQGKTPEQVARSSAEFAAFTQGLKAFEAGGKDEPLVRSQNVAVQHLDVLGDAAKGLQNKNNQLINNYVNRWKAITGETGPTDFEGVKSIVGAELIKAVQGSAGALGDRDAIQRELNSANSPAQLSSMIDKYKRLMAGQLGGLRQTYDRLNTGISFDDRFLSPETKREIARYSPPPPVPPPPGATAGQPAQPQTSDVDYLRANPGKAAAFDKRFGPGASDRILNAAPQQPTAPAQAQGHPVPAQFANHPDGQTFTSPSTGKSFVKQGDQIHPVDPAATDAALKQARAAISMGAPRDAVIARLKAAGIDTKGL